MKFREFLLNEDSKYLSEKIGGILSILHATQEDKDGLGSRDIETYAQKVINQIKPILNISKGSKDVQRSLQKVAVAISIAMEEKKGDELLDIMSKSSQIIEKLLSDMGSPIQDLGTPPEAGKPQDQDSALQPPIEPETPEQPPVDPSQPQQPAPVDPSQPQQPAPVDPRQAQRLSLPQG
jgi:hypothetical protein